jgi:hypothetical protein
MHASCVKVGHVYMHAGLIQAACTSMDPEKKMQPSKESREYWYGRPESLLAQTLAKTQKKGDETNLKLPKFTDINCGLISFTFFVLHVCGIMSKLDVN